MKKDRKSIIILVLALSAFTFMEWIKPKPVDWSPSFSNKDKIPYGNFVLYNNLQNIFPKKNITPIVTTIFETTDSITQWSTPEDTFYAAKFYNYIFISNEFNPGEVDMTSLLTFISKGNNAFIACDIYSRMVEDSLKIKMADSYFNPFVAQDSNNVDSIKLSFVNPALKETYYYKKNMASNYFTSFDTANTTVLGINGNHEATFIKIKFGSGNLFLSSTPLIFTNYAMLQENKSSYVANALSYLPVSDLFWDEHYKMNRVYSSSPLKVILNYEPLRWAYFITICSILLFMFFEAKRRQRTIPVIEPLTNTTLEFVDTVGRLYYQNGNHKNIALKKITYFMDFIRNKYYLKTNKIDKEFIERLSEKSGFPQEDVKKVMSLIEKTNEKNTLTEQELIHLNASLEKFYN
jgi:hypothetical protein